MDTELLAVARTLAERGWLPGIIAANNGTTLHLGGKYVCNEPALCGTDLEAHCHLAAHREIVRRGWSYYVDTGEVGSGGFIDVEQRSEPDTTTLSLLKCLLAACEAAEETR